MFEQSFLPRPAKTRRAWTVMVSFAGQIGVVGFAVLLPLVFIEKPPLGMFQNRPLPPVPRGRAAAPPKPEHVKVVATVRENLGRRPIFQPDQIPTSVARIVDRDQVVEAPPEVGVVGGIGDPGGRPDGVVGGISDLMNRQAAAGPAPPPVVRAPERKRADRPIERIRQGGDVQEALLIHRVTPVYPVLAIKARIEGRVRLAAIIGADGRIRELQVVSGHPMLVRAALDAVVEWRYRPTLLNGDPVEVITQIDVNFTLAR